MLNSDKNKIKIEEGEQVKEEINKQINNIYINLPKFLNKITEYLKEKNNIEKQSYLTFVEKLRNINQKIYEFAFLDLDKKGSSQIGEKIDNSSSLEVSFNQKEYEEKKNLYDNFYGNNSTINETLNVKEEYIKTFLNSVKYIFEEFNYLLNLKNDKILPYYTNLKINDIHIEFFTTINEIYSSFSNKNISSYPKSFTMPSKILDSENMSLGSSLSEFKVNIIESVDDFNIYKENALSIDFLKLNTKNLDDLSFLKGSILIYLKRLELRTNNLSDISPLKDCLCTNLINLNLSHNQLTNNSIEILLNMNLDHLEKLILFDNKITTVKILKLGEKFKNLKKFHIGKNLLNEKEIIENKDKYNLSGTIENIGMSSNFNDCFSNQKNIELKFFKYISLENIKLLYLNRNELFSLKCFENNNFNSLEMVWLTYNNISNIEEIKYFHNKKNKKTLNAFLLNGNNISSISDDFIKLLDQFELNILNISLNPIKLENFKDKIEIIEKKGIRLLNL